VDALSVEAGQPLSLRLVSDDVVHGFAIGQSDQPALELYPGQPVETIMVFDEPGKYVYYCTRWCGPNHWRMRGTIEVGGPGERAVQPPPLYVTLGLDIDAEHHAEVLPEGAPSAARGAALGVELPSATRAESYYRTHSPAGAWAALRAEPGLAGLDDEQVWDLVAYLWGTHTTPEALAEGERLYEANCAACHGESGDGDGVMAAGLAEPAHEESDSHIAVGEIGGMGGTQTPTDFTDAEHMLGASPAVLHGKIVRGGMGTGMPYWGPIFTDEQIWKIVSYLWVFQFQLEVNP
jgi:mono/diheme cytochrome c family protein